MKQCRSAHEIKTGQIKLIDGATETTWAHWDPFNTAYGDDMEANDYLIRPDEQCKTLHDRSRWAVGQGGKVKSAQCEDMVMNIENSQTPANSDIVLATTNELGWNQEWNTQSQSAILLTQNGKPSQEWNAIFVGKCVGRILNLFDAQKFDWLTILSCCLLLKMETMTTLFYLVFLAI